ncbi:hypothetical protein K7X08_037742 [Anisodus acutangulus]|uniref:Uncharacterized protein n=1 Tax=Anisodus acutangulus TaxID=402998 RepID=A0A9Q1N0N1_9SOLA|nr:hypothetical protein K7X08_037742 [Anisodus acutangulus]
METKLGRRQRWRRTKRRGNWVPRGSPSYHHRRRISLSRSAREVPTLDLAIHIHRFLLFLPALANRLLYPRSPILLRWRQICYPDPPERSPTLYLAIQIYRRGH